MPHLADAVPHEDAPDAGAAERRPTRAVLPMPASPPSRTAPAAPVGPAEGVGDAVELSSMAAHELGVGNGAARPRSSHPSATPWWSQVTGAAGVDLAGSTPTRL